MLYSRETIGKVADPIELLPGVYIFDFQGKMRIATYQPKQHSVYGETIVEGYRIWDPHRSKLAAFLIKSYEASGISCISSIGLCPKSKVLYLGAATGTTVSHVADIVHEGIVYAVEHSSRSMRDLLRFCETRHNVVPVLGDAARPEAYSILIEPVEVVYQDVAQQNQAEIACRNASRYLRENGTLIFMMKTRSIDVTRSPKEVYASEIKKLKGFDLLEEMDLRPFHRDHWAVLAKKTS